MKTRTTLLDLVNAVNEYARFSLGTTTAPALAVA
jgi:hypothetical protein